MNLLEPYELELELYFHIYKVFQLFKSTDHLSKFTVVTKGLTEGSPNYFLIEKSIMVIPKHIIILKVSIIGLTLYKELGSN